MKRYDLEDTQPWSFSGPRMELVEHPYGDWVHIDDVNELRAKVLEAHASFVSEGWRPDIKTRAARLLRHYAGLIREGKA